MGVMDSCEICKAQLGFAVERRACIDFQKGAPQGAVRDFQARTLESVLTN